jgi:hypothetical protein
MVRPRINQFADDMGITIEKRAMGGMHCRGGGKAIQGTTFRGVS